MNKPFSYESLYALAEEWAQLCEPPSALQLALGLDSGLYSLKFYSPKWQERWLHIDLSAARPWMVSTISPLPIKKAGPTPVQNFLRAHFVGRRLVQIEVAQKPNRQFRFSFETQVDEAPVYFEWHGFPHGQKLVLFAEKKRILWPAGKIMAAQDVVYVAVDPLPQTSWERNNLVFSELKWGLKPLTPPKAQPETKTDPRLAKIQKAIKKMEQVQAEVTESIQKKIDTLKAESDSLNWEGENQAKRQRHFDEIKKLKTRLTEFAQKKNDLEKKNQELLKNPLSQDVIEKPQKASRQKGKENSGFKGVRVSLDSQWQLWVGRSADQNDLLLRLAQPHEFWIHLRNEAGAHGLLRGPKGKDAPTKHVDFACRVVAQLSQGQKSKFQDGEALEFIFVPRKYVKKPKGFPAGRVLVERESIRRVIFKTESFVTF